MVAPILKFLAKFEENAFSQRFHFKANRKSIALKNGTRDFQNSPPLESSACFYVIIAGNFELFQKKWSTFFQLKV